TSEKLGCAQSVASRHRGADGSWFSAPTALSPPCQIAFVPITTSEELRKAVMARFAESDVLIMAAAVADFRPVRPAPQKISKSKGRITLILEPTPDSLMEPPGRPTS